MSRFPERSQSALLVIDVQRNVMAASVGSDEVVARIAALVERARAESVPIVWVQHSDDEMARDSDGWRIVPELVPAAGEPIVHKLYGDSFSGTDLEQRLAALGVGRLVVVGAQTDACIRSTLHGALARGYDAVLVSDAHTTEDMREWGSPIGPEDAIAYTNLYWSFSSAEDCRGGVATAADVALSTQ